MGATMKSNKTRSSAPGLESKLNTSDIEIQKFVAALKKENLKLHQKIAKLQAEKVSLESRIKVIEEEYSKYRQEHPAIEISEEQKEELKKFTSAYVQAKIRNEIT